MKQLQLEELDAKAVRAALKSGEETVIVDGDRPLVKLVSVAAEMQARAAFFKHYPHDPGECFNTCWRHDGSAERELADAEPAPAAAG